MKFHRPLVEHVVLSLEEIFVRHQHADKVIERNLKFQKKWGARDRRFFAESVYELVRWWRYLGFLAGFDPTLTKDLSKENLWQIWGAWCFNKYQDLPSWAELQNFDREIFAARKTETPSLAVKESIPDWLNHYGEKAFGAEWPSLLHSLNEPAEVFLRANNLKISREELMRKLQSENIEVTVVPDVPAALRLSERKNLASSESFKLGLFEVQDAASQLVAPLLQVSPGQKVIDACAGGGGKSLHLAALMKNKGSIVSMDVHAWKLKSLETRAQRNHVSIIKTRLIDSPKVIAELAGSADRVLLDVPCSGLGVLRRNPDTKWKMSLEELEKLQALQKEILFSYSQMVKSGGLLVYATCSVLPAENQDQVAHFLKECGDRWELVEEIHVFPHRQGFDGFYGALLRRKA